VHNSVPAEKYTYRPIFCQLVYSCTQSGHVPPPTAIMRPCNGRVHDAIVAMTMQIMRIIIMQHCNRRNRTHEYS